MHLPIGVDCPGGRSKYILVSGTQMNNQLITLIVTVTAMVFCSRKCYLQCGAHWVIICYEAIFQCGQSTSSIIARLQLQTTSTGVYRLWRNDGTFLDAHQFKHLKKQKVVFYSSRSWVVSK